MGSWFSKNEEVEVENNIVQITGDVSLAEKELFVMITIICAVKVMEFLYMAFKVHHKHTKKRIESSLFRKQPV